MSEGWIGLVCNADTCQTYPAAGKLRAAVTIEVIMSSYDKKDKGGLCFECAGDEVSYAG